ncbi:hypothetical protein DXG01_015087 [Tephrocybe rancida]|nr:hypothetical protein DXG01_015087 [Tephrocybe rancida]
MTNDKAYTRNISVSMELITCKFRMMINLPGKKTQQIVHNIMENMDNIPVRIGARELKNTAFAALLPQYLKWLHGYPLTIVECELRTHKWRPFFKLKAPNSSIKVFATGICEIWLATPYEKYESICTRLNGNPDDDNNVPPANSFERLATLETDTVAEPVKKRTQKQPLVTEFEEGSSKLKIRLPALKDCCRPLSKVPSAATTPPSSFRAAQSLEQASTPIPLPGLVVQQPVIPHAPQIPKAKKAITVPATPKLMLHFDGAELWKAVSSQTPPNCHVTRALSAPSSGTFKMAWTGLSTVPLFHNASHEICLKKAHMIDKEKCINIFYDGPKQLEQLIVKLNCLGWASALLDLVYALIAEVDECKGCPTFEVPQLQFVSAGIAISMDDDKTVFLVEECILTSDGTFVKYINNNDPCPRKFANDQPHTLQAQFLTFTQHVQYTHSNEKMFVSDFQGGLSLLTDPQIITVPAPEQLFAGRNLNFGDFKR